MRAKPESLTLISPTQPHSQSLRRGRYAARGIQEASRLTCVAAAPFEPEAVHQDEGEISKLGPFC